MRYLVIDYLTRDSDVMLAVRVDTIRMLFKVVCCVDLPLAIVSSLAGCGSACILSLSQFALMLRTIATVN